MESQIDVLRGDLLYRQGKLSEAEAMARRGLEKGTGHFAAQSEMLLQAQVCLGDILSAEERHTEAERYYRQSLEIEEGSRNVAGMIFDLQRLSDCLLRQGRRSDAEPVIERAIEVEKAHALEFAKAKGMQAENLKLTTISQPKLHFCRGEYVEARRIFRDQVEHWSNQKSPPDNIDPAQMQFYLAATEEAAGQYDEAARQYEAAAAAFERDWCPGHPKALAARRAKDAVLQRQLTQGPAPAKIAG